MADVPAASPRKKGLLLLFTIFLIGLICGAALLFMGARLAGHLHGWRMGPIEHRPPDPIGHLTRELDLDADQIERAREILDQSRREMHEALEQTHAELLELLTPEQRERFDRLRSRHRRGRGGGHGMGRPPHLRPPPPPPLPPPPDS
ncbi:MAG: periplasmic heavy metal sensor [Acidobacteriota bacterium]|nr:periplasmic heavy metal sensor [Acidobacteriota bacterium]